MHSHGEGGLAEFAAIADPASRLRELLTTVVQAVQPLAPSVHLSLLGDRNDPRVRDAIHQVNRARLALLAHTYQQLGLPQDRAAGRARIAYAAILGLLHLAQTDQIPRPRLHPPRRWSQSSCRHEHLAGPAAPYGVVLGGGQSRGTAVSS